MHYHETLIAQYGAALEMLRQSILACPEALWLDPEQRTAFSQVAYHALFFTHLYLQDSVAAFRYWPGHRDAYRFEADTRTEPAESPDKSTVLAYLGFCQHELVERIPAIALDAASGFDWLPFTKFELQLYSLRHLQQHVGELMERLGEQSISVDWVGSYRADSSAT